MPSSFTFISQNQGWLTKKKMEYSHRGALGRDVISGRDRGFGHGITSRLCRGFALTSCQGFDRGFGRGDISGFDGRIWP